VIVPLIQLFHSFLLLILEFVSYPEFYVYPYLVSLKLLPYSQIIDHHFPGLFMLPVNFYTLNFQDPASFKSLLVILVIFQSALIAKITKKLFSSKLVSCVSVLAFALWQPIFQGNQLWVDTILPLFILLAFNANLNSKWFQSGLFLGLGLIFKQSLLPLVALAFILHPSKKFLIGAAVPLLAILSYFWYLGVLSDFLYWTIPYNLLTYAQLSAKLPITTDLLKLALPALIILVSLRHAKLRILIIWLVFSIFGGLSRFELVHLQPGVPFLAILTGALFVNKKSITGLTLATLMFLEFIGYIRHQNNFFKYRFFDTTTLSVAKKIIQYSDSNKSVFLFGVQPHLYALTHTRPVGSFFVFPLPWLLTNLQNRQLQAIQLDPPKLIVYDTASVVDGQPLSVTAPILLEYILRYYKPIDRDGSVIFYENRY